MRIEVNVETGEITEHEDEPITWEIPIETPLPTPTIEELSAQLQTLQSQLIALTTNTTKS